MYTFVHTIVNYNSRRSLRHCVNMAPDKRRICLTVDRND